MRGAVQWDQLPSLEVFSSVCIVRPLLFMTLAHSFKVILDVVPTPTRVTHILPVIVDRPAPSAIRETIDGTGASQAETTVLCDRTTVQARHTLRREIPVDRRV
jgi:hypothetical protein